MRTEMSLKYDFIESFQSQRGSMSALCESFGISRKTGYKWWNRFCEHGEPGLEDQRNSRPERKGMYSEAVWEAVIASRKDNPTYGPRKIVQMLRNEHPSEQWPSISLVKQRFREHGLSSPRKSRRRIVAERLPLRPIDAANVVWCIDLKGWFTSKDGKRCAPLTLLDGYSRYLLLCELVSPPNYGAVKPLLEKAFYEFGKPCAVRSDNGAPFGSAGLRGLTPLSVWLLKQGIWPEKITPGNPGQNGRLERLHRTLKADALHPVVNFAEYHDRLLAFKDKYNTIRPHEALGDMPPATVYTRSKREYFPDKTEEYEYPEGFRMVKVGRRGYISQRGEQIYVSESLAKEYVGVGCKDIGEPILFLGYPLGTLDEHRKGKKRQP
jgi:Transposase and inactivated derivatives